MGKSTAVNIISFVIPSRNNFAGSVGFALYKEVVTACNDFVFKLMAAVPCVNNKQYIAVTLG